MMFARVSSLKLSKRASNPMTILLYFSNFKNVFKVQLGTPKVIYIIQNKKMRKIWW
jgi:hypothetical protein